MDPLLLFAVLPAGAALGLLWEEWHRRDAIRREKEARCQHTFGDAFRVNTGWISPYWKQVCTRCAAQRDCDKDGQPL
jgi:hypothetical protein